MLNKKKVIVVLDNIRSVHNVGAILRTCDGAGVDEIVLCGITPTPDHKKVHKTALNAEEYVKWTYFKETKDAIEYVKRKDYKIWAVEQDTSSKDINDMDFIDKNAFVFGNEITGIPPLTINLCDGTIELPMEGRKNSLNVSTCVGIIIYYYKLKNE